MLDLVIFDLEDTLAFTAHRAHFLQHTTIDWDAYCAACSKDAPSDRMAAVFYDHFTASKDMWIVSENTEAFREPVEDWLFSNGIYYNRLVMRAAGDVRSALDVKLHWLHDGTIPRERVLCAYDNDLDAIRMYQAEGILGFHALFGEA